MSNLHLRYHHHLIVIYRLTLDFFIHDDLGLVEFGAVHLRGLLPRQLLYLVTVVLAGVRRVLVTDRPSLEDALLTVWILEGVEELAEAVVATEFQQLHFL